MFFMGEQESVLKLIKLFTDEDYRRLFIKYVRTKRKS